VLATRPSMCPGEQGASIEVQLRGVHERVALKDQAEPARVSAERADQQQHDPGLRLRPLWTPAKADWCKLEPLVTAHPPGSHHLGWSGRSTPAAKERPDLSVRST
jgi:hypothetical protein